LAAEDHPAHAKLTFEELYRLHHDRVWRTIICLGVPAEAQEDALQEVFLVVHRRLDTFDAGSSSKAWIYAITRRVAWTHHRGRTRTRRKLDAIRDDPAPRSISRSLEEELALREASTLVMRFLDTLGEAQRTAFVLSEIENLRVAEIAQIVEANPNTVQSRLRLARRRFERWAAAHAKRKERECGDV